ncbi:hypothetical protein [Sulfurimonas sp.]|uniref:hypothetical protein n=1 Tax=Sulfurimonas sp. TaxID=2022749 RepID=UPI002B480D0A|nr:hypothetical protein [Sulfurimonas sp.]
MRILLLLVVIISFIFISSLYISKEDGSLDKELKLVKKIDIKPLQILHDKFLNLDIDAKGFDLQKAIKEIKQARKLYPLDNKLKMIDMKLENKRANEAYKSTKDSTPNN